MNADNVFVIEHDEFGREAFHMVAAQYNLYQTEDGIWEFTLSFRTDDALVRAPGLADVIDARPNFEATALLPADDLALTPGRVITQAQGYDYERDEHLSNIYYFEHNDVEALVVTIHAITPTELVADVQGRAVINGSNGLLPDATLSIQAGRFQLAPDLQRGVM